MSADKFHCNREDCAFRAIDQYEVHRCNYFFLTGKSRIAQHPPGQRAPSQCRLYVPRGQEKKVRQTRNTSDPIWGSMVRTLNAQGKNDTEIGQIIGIEPWIIGAFRRRNGIPGIRGSYGKRRSFDEEKALALYKNGKRDSEIAEGVHVSRQTIASWRNDLGLPPNSDRKLYRRPESKFDWDAAARLYDKGRSDREIAKVLGCTYKTVWKWRNRTGRPVKKYKENENG